MAVGGDGEDLTGVTLGQDLLNDLHQDGLCCTALLDDECVGTLHLCCAAVEQAAFVLAQVQLVHQLVDVLAAGTDQVNSVLPVLLAAALEDVAECVQQAVVTVVTAVCLVAQHQSGPLDVGHSGGTGVGQHVDGQHASGECELVPVSSVQSTLTLLDGDLGQVTDCVSVRVGSSCLQGILLSHDNNTSKKIFVSDEGASSIVFLIPRSSL